MDDLKNITGWEIFIVAIICAFVILLGFLTFISKATPKENIKLLTFQELLLQNPDYGLVINDSKLNYNNGEDNDLVDRYLLYDNIVIHLKTKKGEGKIYLSSKTIIKEKLIPNTGVYCKLYEEYSFHKELIKSDLYFYKQIIKPITKKKENKMFSLTNILLMVLIAFVVPKMTLKMIFKPTKKAAKQIKKDWNES